ncbi:MAG: hypothetical protein RI959_1678 [Pseudomonadota bacterium]|jgi:sulfur-carrier protein
MQIQLRLFASIREAVGQGTLTLETNATTVGGLRDELLARGAPWEGVLARGRVVRASLDQAMVNEQAQLTPGCEVGFFPPVTGG